MKKFMLFFISLLFVLVCFCKKGEINIQQEKNRQNNQVGQMVSEVMSFVQVGKKTSVKEKLEKKIKKISTSNNKKKEKNTITIELTEKQSDEPDPKLIPRIPSPRARKIQQKF
jgi:hypothetical protein